MAVPGLPSPLTSMLTRRAVRDGVFGGSGAWRAVAVVLFGARVLRRLSAKQPDVLLTEELRPGESMLITPIAPPSRAERRAHRRRRRSGA